MVSCKGKRENTVYLGLSATLPASINQASLLYIVRDLIPAEMQGLSQASLLDPVFMFQYCFIPAPSLSFLCGLNLSSSHRRRKSFPSVTPQPRASQLSSPRRESDLQEQVFSRRECFKMWEWPRRKGNRAVLLKTGGVGMGLEPWGDRGGAVESLTFRVVVALAPDATGELVAWTKRKSLSSKGQAPWTRHV